MKRPAIDGGRLLRDIEELNRLGAEPGPGINRVAYSPADMAGRQLVGDWLRELGFSVRQDEAGNVSGVLPGTADGLPPLALGSHTDTVPNGGPLDGTLGVAAAVACARSLSAGSTRLRHPLEIIDFAAEEATMGGGLLGSRALSGQLEKGFGDAAGWDGRPVSEHLAGAGLDWRGLAAARREPGSLAAYLELHIEQGAILDRSGVPVAVVPGIVGIRRYQVVFTGQANHAGTTPMDQRDDALVKAVPFVLDVEGVGRELGLVATVGTFAVLPGASNVIPGRVELSFEIRSLDDGLLDQAGKRLLGAAEERGGEPRPISASAPVQSSPQVVSALEAACENLGQAHRLLPSGAGHDAMSIAAISQSAMLFIPSRGGISHAPEEYSTPEQCVAGAEVLLAGLLELDARLD
ncbi:MAG: Zn-dependent hydrolase [Candidatus Dormibacteraeota bacterium]|uniref:Zn-dependent hydrolase n=1 Tax=Candidatus Dormiibacter inghamiae TaxID=3127013 RepID=A0A934N6B0_9BACT|nr:Zn-dependent hydrolase [Candidatus Dormibacteraeota bacterium]MBJ7604908.1 Zn-dependent hydrolase [Candidatus Dormibacteraeota bacterium]